jgi:hypothetical protein
MSIENVYLFRGVDGLHSDTDGNFFYNEKAIKKYWRVGQIYIQIKEKRYGIKTLRKLAYKSTKEKEYLPF